MIRIVKTTRSRRPRDNGRFALIIGLLAVAAAAGILIKSALDASADSQRENIKLQEKFHETFEKTQRLRGIEHPRLDVEKDYAK